MPLSSALGMTAPAPSLEKSKPREISAQPKATAFIQLHTIPYPSLFIARHNTAHFMATTFSRGRIDIFIEQMEQ